MDSIKPILKMVILGSVLLSGCSSRTRVEGLSSDIQTLNSKVDQLNNDMNAMLSDVQVAKEDAIRANQRLDNQVTRYRK